MSTSNPQSQSIGSDSDYDEDKGSYEDDPSSRLGGQSSEDESSLMTSLLLGIGDSTKRGQVHGQPVLGTSPSSLSSNGGINSGDKDSFWWIRQKELGPSAQGGQGGSGETGWRHSKSSMSTVFYSAEDVTDYMSEISTNSGDTLRSRQSYHSVLRAGDDGDENDGGDVEDIFISPTQSPVPPERKPQKSVAFSMAMKDVDFVLVWDATNILATTQEAQDRREIYERNLQEEGLVLEYEKMEVSNYNFVKIHAPQEILRRYAGILKLKMKMRDLDDDVVQMVYAGNPEFESLAQQIGELEETVDAFRSKVKKCWKFSTSWFKMDPRLFPPKDHRLSAVYSRDKEYLFDLNDEDFFTSTVRGQIVEFILNRKRYSLDNYDDFAFGIERLRRMEVYCAYYPLHDGDLRTPGSSRYLLFHEWASLRRCFKYQPLDAVKDYFGVKVAMYFAWLGFYTHYLIPAAIFGVICFFYGVFTLYSNKLSEDICKADDIYMCPLCDRFCDFYKLSDTCGYARMTYLFDNSATILFAVVMSFWTAIYLEMWKRYSASIGFQWDVGDFDVHEEHPRPEYLVRLKKIRNKDRVRNRVTLVNEPKVPFWKMKVPYTMFSLSMVLFLITMAIAAVIGVIIYRLSTAYFFAKLAKKHKEFYTYSLIIVNTSAAVINLIFIFFFNWLYGLVAQQLTELELHRTQTQYEDSLTLKLYLLQFINYYSSIFYIAFFKGKFVGSPHKYTKFLGFRQEECAPGGCMTELCLQLAIILIGKQLLNMFTETLIPKGMKYWNQLKILGTKKSSVDKETLFGTQWVKDLKLLEWDHNSLFNEYLEMILQYGFVTIFVAAFPLAPFFALLNNIFEMRLDAKKLISFHRRPVGSRVRDIGVWYGIMDSIGKLAVISNAFIIAFTSNFIPKLVYMYGIPEQNPTHSMDGYLEDSLAYFDVKDSSFSAFSKPENTTYPNIEVCRYQEYRSNFTLPEGQRYKRTSHYWKVWMARLAFIVIFENVVALAVMLLKWLIPDIPSEVRERIRRDEYLTNEIIIKKELERLRISAVGDSTGINPLSQAVDIELENLGSTHANSLFSTPKRKSGGSDAEVMV